MQLVSLDQNTKEFVLNSKLFGIFKVFVIKNALWLHVAKTRQTYCKRAVVFNQIGHKYKMISNNFHITKNTAAKIIQKYCTAKKISW